MTSGKIKLLFVDSEEKLQNSFLKAMGDESLVIETASEGKEALTKLKRFHADIVITDARIPQMDGISLLRQIRSIYPDIFVIVVTGCGNLKEAVSVMKEGAYDYIQKPFNLDIIRNLLEKIYRHKKILQKNLALDKECRKKYRFENIIGQDPKMFEIFQKIIDVASSNATVLITGESGTGKELIAEAIHFRSARKQAPLVQVNCAALTETLTNSELFGHEKGAFTGAIAQKKGHFELADGGTIFLDEIGDIPISTQLSLLRVLETGTFHRVGGTKTIKVNVRIVCATNKDLTRAVKDKLFREDLFYRINVVTLHVPPLRERKSDLSLLAHHFLKKHSADTQKDIGHFSKKAMDMLIKHDWPGNVRELTNVIENAIIFCKGREITPADLPTSFLESTQAKVFTLPLFSWSLPEAESLLIRKVLEETNWNLKLAAAELDIARGTLYSKIKKYDIQKPDNSGL